MKRNTLVLIGVLAILILVAVFQIIQFSAISSKLSNLKASGITEASTSAPTTSSNSGSGKLPGVLANLPSQVGGC